MKDAKDLIPWKVTDISLRPYDGFWSFNPSVHFDGTLWRCVLRCCDYAMPNGVTIRAKKAGPGHQTKNAMVIFDPDTWRPIQVFKMQERDNTTRVPCANVGYEDMRLFVSDRGGLQGIAASLHLARGGRQTDGGQHQHQPPEQVVLSFDTEYNIVGARPIRGDWWSGMPQKNWVPFDQSAEPRFLYSIGRGTMFDDRGALKGDEAVARPSTRARPVPTSIPIAQSPAVTSDAEREQERAREEEHAREQERQREHEQRERERDERRSRNKQHPDRRTSIRGGGDVQMVRGGRMTADTLSTRPSSSSSTRHVVTRGGGNESSRVLGNGRTLMPRYDGLRGGTQLLRVSDDAWLGIGHEMKFEKGLKYYWHTWYLVDSRGKMTAASPPMKFASNGIEFAAGMAIDGDRVVVSFGVDDMNCVVGETRLSAVLEMLRPVER